MRLALLLSFIFHFRRSFHFLGSEEFALEMIQKRDAYKWTHRHDLNETDKVKQWKKECLFLNCIQLHWNYEKSHICSCFSAICCQCSTHKLLRVLICLFRGTLFCGLFWAAAASFLVARFTAACITFALGTAFFSATFAT